jgi:Flp pilus assembly pilin Flp
MKRLIPRSRSAIAGLRSDEHGLTTVEYALIIAVAAVILVAGVMLLGGGIGDRVSTTGSGPGALKPPPTVQCDPSYAGVCIPPPPPKLDCADLRARGIPLPVTVVGPDPHDLDPDRDGLACAP